MIRAFVIEPDLAGLSCAAAPLVGQPFRFAVFSYGDELHLDFGDLRPWWTKRFGTQFSGAYTLGMRASPWTIESGDGSRVLASSFIHEAPHEERMQRKAEVVADPLITPDSVVTAAEPFAVDEPAGFGLRLSFSDGATFVVTPAGPEPPDPEFAHLPPLVDWELLTPMGLLTAGPGLVWAFEPDDKPANPAPAAANPGEEP